MFSKIFSLFKKPSENEVPLIWTSKGNLPISDMEHKYGWEEDDEKHVFWQEYWYKGELVSRQVNVKSKFSFSELASRQGAING